MEPMKLAEWAQRTGGRLHGGKPERVVAGVTIDSRRVQGGEVFAALRGERFDGHDFVAAAAARGAGAALVERPVDAAVPQIVVPDALAALSALGSHARACASQALVVGITGTNGKTGTKDLTLAALSPQRRTVASAASFNNALGVPLTLLKAGSDTEAVVVELGTNAPGEIAALTALARPHVGVITNIHAGHLEGLGSVAGVRQEKGCLLEGLEGPQLSILNQDDPSLPLLRERAPGEVVTFGCSPGADLRATHVECSLAGTRFMLEGWGPVSVRHLGRHAALNALAALAVARAAGVDLGRAIAALADVPAPPGRLQIKRVGPITLLDDSYNANPGSLAAAAAAVSEIGHRGRRVFVVGDMLELGAGAPEMHREAGRALAQCFPDLLVAVGQLGEEIVRGARDIGMERSRTHVCADRLVAEDLLAGLLAPGDLVLIKASRRTALDALVSRLASGVASPGGEASVAP